MPSEQKLTRQNNIWYDFHEFYILNSQKDEIEIPSRETEDKKLTWYFDESFSDSSVSKVNWFWIFGSLETAIEIPDKTRAWKSR